MEKFSLEVEDWGEWKLDRDFSSLERAKQYALANFPHNQWRIYDRIRRTVIDHSGLLESVGEELHRIRERERWRNVFAERAIAEVRERQNRERLLEISASQRQQNRLADRRERLRGFTFVNSRPSVLEQLAEWDDEPRSDSLEDKFNWRIEGF